MRALVRIDPKILDATKPQAGAFAEAVEKFGIRPEQIYDDGL